MSTLEQTLAPLVADFHGVVSVSTGDSVEFEQAYGLANRQYGVPARVDTQYAIASGTKSFTALTIMALVEGGALRLDTTARSLLGADLPLVDDRVTVEHLLTHRSGIGDYCDEDLPELPPPNVPYYELTSTDAYLPALDGFPAKFAPGERFSYCNGGYVVLALLAQRAGGAPFADLVTERVWAPAGMRDSVFLRSDRLPPRAATGYLDDGRTNLFSVPLVGSGDGGAFTTAADMRAFWPAFLGGRIVAVETAGRMITPGPEPTGDRFEYGLGFWLAPDRALAVVSGADNGVSFVSTAHVPSGRVITVLSNTGETAFALARPIRDLLFA